MSSNLIDIISDISKFDSLWVWRELGPIFVGNDFKWETFRTFKNLCLRIWDEICCERRSGNWRDENTRSWKIKVGTRVFVCWWLNFRKTEGRWFVLWSWPWPKGILVKVLVFPPFAVLLFVKYLGMYDKESSICVTVHTLRPCCLPRDIWAHLQVGSVGCVRAYMSLHKPVQYLSVWGWQKWHISRYWCHVGVFLIGAQNGYAWLGHTGEPY